MIAHCSRCFRIVLIEFYRITRRSPLCKELNIADTSVRNNLYSFIIIVIITRIPTAKHVTEFCRIFKRYRSRSNIIFFGIFCSIRSAVQIVDNRVINNFPYSGICSIPRTVITNRYANYCAGNIRSHPTDKRIPSLSRRIKRNISAFNRVVFRIIARKLTTIQVISDIIIRERPFCPKCNISCTAGCNCRNLCVCRTACIRVPSIKHISTASCTFKINIRTRYSIFGRILFTVYTAIQVVCN